MPFYLTRDPVPSADMRNVFDNAQNLDLALNDLTSSLWTDRLGRSRMSWFGLESAFSVKLSDFESRFTSQIVEQEATFDASQADKENRFQHFLVSSGYVFLGDYENGPFQFSARNQYIRYNNQYYRLNAATDVGFTTTGTDATSFANDVTHFVLMDGDTLRQNLGSGEPGMGADMLAFRDLLGTNFNLGSYIREGYIRVSSRDELVTAVNYVNTVVMKATEIRLSRVFEPWTAAQTDIDLTWVSLVGEGGFCYIDATGIPNVEGNYWLRLFNSGASNINNLGNIYAAKLSGIFAIGPGAASLVDAVLYHAPSGSASSFTTRNLGTMSFRTGDSYRNNAYIIKHWGRSISRCANHVWMPAGYSNYGEAIEYYASTISTSNGVGVRNDNANGDIRIHGGSCDYMGRIAVANAGRIEFDGTHIEFNNASNKLTGIPFETASAETSEIVITGGRILGFVTPLPVEVTTLFQCGANTNGITLDKVMLMNVSLNDSTMPINSGTGPFTTKDIRVIAGGGNPKVPMLKADAQNLLYDPNFTQDNIVDWYIKTDTGALTSRTAGVNLNLVKDTATFRSGGNASMKVTKTYGVGSASEIQVRVPIKPNKLAMYELYLFGAGLTGNIFISAFYHATMYNNSLGIPVSARSVQVGPVRTINATTLTDWVRVIQQAARNYTPEWATHLVISVNLSSMSAGSLYIDDAKVTDL
ncbi:TPA: hypothetical protein L9E73_004981 [Klebsiella pneumoniae]|uniref:hypothetical protein n=1 Tax=Klebsiella pneumoniae TaxID=573 RepID=UPI0027EF399A|nr:hypothetical protein [Klebsiella pneumoniae]HDU5065653.1 hypothetical protein [Klebsiella pneumoniae subsp. pneumoniae]